jgi:NAD-dependent SIR2 family protein deacetylase
LDNSFIKTSIRKIKEASDNNKLVLFVGAGVSANSGVPIWKQVIKKMAEDLGIKEIEDSIETYLKIPQYYFNERGEKEYFDKLHEIFLSKQYTPNPIHKELFKLNPIHIVTTNYDNLLESAANEGGLFYHIVREDRDLPYNNVNKTIIKMHGDFVNRNIVLKEDDYLSYSKNFMLIENYLKSLIATNTVLFVGYSASDPNFKLIFQWVKDILKSHFQPAYLIEISKPPSRMEYNYYKNRGINILYYAEIEGIIKKHNIFTDERGNKLFDIINYIVNFNEYNDLDDVNYIYNKIKCFEGLNFIMPDEIIKKLELKSVHYDYGDNMLDLSDEDNPLARIFSKERNDEKEKNENDEKEKNENLEKLIDLFKKANIKGIRLNDQTLEEWEISDTLFIDEKLDKLYSFNYLNEPLTNIYDNQKYFPLDYYRMLENAYLLYKSEEYLEAYNLYKQISFHSFQRREYLIYFISEFNRKHVGELLKYSFRYRINGEILNEIEKIDLESIYIKMPHQEKISLEFLKDIPNFQFIYKNKMSLDKEIETIKKSKALFENGGFSINNSIIKSINLTRNLWSFINLNYLCIEHYREVQSLYKSFIEGVLVSYSTNNKSTDKFFSSIQPTKVTSLDKFTIHLMIEHIKDDELEKLFKSCNLSEVEVETEAKNYLLDSFVNVINAILGGKNRNRNQSYLYNILMIFSKINIDINDYKQIISDLLSLFKENLLYLNELKYINRFIVSTAKKKIVEKEMLTQMLIEYLKLCVKDNKFIEFDRVGFYNNLINIIKNEFDYTFEHDLIAEIIYNIDMKVKNGDKKINYLLFERILIPIYSLLPDEQKETIQSLIKSFVKSLKNNEKLSDTEIDIYFLALIHHIIRSDKSINKIIIETIVNEINNTSTAMSFPDPIERKLTILTDLYRKKHIYEEEFSNYIDLFKGRCEYFDLFFVGDGEEINFNDLEILGYLDQEEIDNIMKNNEVKNKIYELFEKELLQNHPNPIFKEIFDKYYVRKY